MAEITLEQLRADAPTCHMIQILGERGYKVLAEQTWRNDQDYREAHELAQQIDRELEYGRV